MSRLLFDDMKPRRVVGWDPATGNIRVKDGDKVREMEMFLNAQGRPYYDFPKPAPIDQLGEQPKPMSLEDRWAGAGIDQG